MASACLRNVQRLSAFGQPIGLHDRVEVSHDFMG
jgi:hypothetical protein